MARKPTVLAAAPTLPAATVNFNAMHAAIARGASADDAVKAGVEATGAPKPEPETPNAPAAKSADGADA
jgi:hypothetical protein